VDDDLGGQVRFRRAIGRSTRGHAEYERANVLEKWPSALWSVAPWPPTTSRAGHNATETRCAPSSRRSMAFRRKRFLLGHVRDGGFAFHGTRITNRGGRRERPCTPPAVAGDPVSSTPVCQTSGGRRWRVCSTVPAVTRAKTLGLPYHRHRRYLRLMGLGQPWDPA
jgi:hypothetical protein